MGYCKIKKIGPGKVRFLHQLNSDGTAYAEDVTIESEVPGRLAYYEAQDGQVGVLNYSFSPVVGDHSSLKFPEE